MRCDPECRRAGCVGPGRRSVRARRSRLNNAGAEQETKPTADLTEEEWDRIITINLRGVFVCMKYEIPLMLNQGGGVIVNTSSGAGVKGAPTLLPSSSDTPWSSTAAKRCNDAPRELKPDGYELTGAGHRMLGVTCDDSSEAQVAAMVDRAVGTFGKLDIAFNSAHLEADLGVLGRERRSN
jgi:NAD(P)-dependent dehydrogenase (short-subunit alcohol dehydrogenase family)